MAEFRQQLIAWNIKNGSRNSNCIQCYFAIKEEMHKKKEHFLNHFNIAPGFRAAIHLGEVTTGEIGALKKEIVFTGDVLNTAARIQELCKAYNTDFLVSEAVKNLMKRESGLLFFLEGETVLRGRKADIKIYSVEKK